MGGMGFGFGGFFGAIDEPHFLNKNTQHHVE
jgi:hypothetical protein